MPNPRALIAAAILTVLSLSACGGDDDGASGDRIGFGRGSDTPSVADLLDDDAAGDIVEDILSGEDPSEAIADLADGAESMMRSFADEGSGRIEIHDEIIEFTSEFCFAGDGDFSIEGLGEARDGTPVWVSIARSVDSREELAEYFDEQMLEALYGDAEAIIDISIDVDFGREEIFGGNPDDQPSFSSRSGTIDDSGQISIDVSGSSVSGEGIAQDHNFVAGDWEARFPFTFEASCA